MSAETVLPAARRPWRVNGILVLAALVVAGMGVTGVYYHVKAPAILAQMRREIDNGPKTAEGRVERWIQWCGPMIDQRLVQLRMSPRQPWIVSHVVEVEGGEAQQEIWGVDLSEHSAAWTAREGLNAVVTLPAAKLLGHGPIDGDNARNVPRYRTGSKAIDPNDRARQIAEWGIELLAKALVRDIEGAHLIVRVGTSETPIEAQQNEGK